MPIITPTSLEVVKKGQLIATVVSDQPLRLALENCNYLYRYHQPLHLSVIYNSTAAVTRTSEYHIPVTPSVDGIAYTFVQRWVCSAATQTVTVGVDYCTTYAGAGTVWTNLYSAAVVSAGAGTLTRSTSAAYTVPSNALAVRVTLTAPGAGTRTDHGLLMWPTAAAPTVGVKTSGFIPFDDGLIDSADGAAVHEEWLQRCAVSSRAIAADRKQCAFAFVQEFLATPAFVCSDTILGSATAGYALPAVRVYLPSGGAKTLTVKAIASVSAGSTVDRVRLSAVGDNSVLLDAAGGIDSASVGVQTTGDGFAAAVDVLLTAYNTATNSTKIYAVVAWWTPPQDADNIVGWLAKKWPLAQAAYLSAAARRVEGVALGPYCGPGHLFDGISTGLTTRYHAAQFAPGADKGRAAITRSWEPQTSQATVTQHDLTSTTAAAIIVQVPWVAGTTAPPSPAWGTIPISSNLTITGGDDLSASGNGSIHLTQQDTPGNEAYSITYATGISLWLWKQTADLEAL